jgi:serine protease Do
MVEDLREVFNVDRGVLVLSVADGTPADRAGLRGGDVIIAVDDQPISRPVELQRVLRRLDKREVRLDVVRKQRKEQVRRTLTLAW